MYSVDEIVSSEINKQLTTGKRVVNIKLPTHEDFSGYLRVCNYDIYFWDTANKKLRFESKKINMLFKWLVWLIKVTLFVLQNVFAWPISLMTIFSLSVDCGYLGHDSLKKDKVDTPLIKSISKHIKIHKKQCNKYKKIKKAICIVIDEKTPSEQLNSALILADLANNKFISDSAIVILSKVNLLRPPQIILPIYNLSAEDSAFVNDFGMDILTCIRNEDYFSATQYLSDFITKQGVKNISVFNFVMQCLAFCFKSLNSSDLKELFLSNSLNIQQEISFGLDKKFVEFSSAEHNFLRFCYRYILQYYHNIAGTQSADFDLRFRQISEDIKCALYNKNEYFSAAQLYSKFATTENAVDAFIIAYIHSEFIENTVSDECLLAIMQYKDISTKSALFLKSYELSYQETPTADEVNALINEIDELKLPNPILRLCYYYLLVNPVYKSSEGCYDKFLEDFRKAYDEIPCGNNAFKCLFGSQFLLLYSTIENVALHKKYAKFVALTLQFVMERKELLKDKNVYMRICRSLNGIAVDKFHSNLEIMRKAETKNNIKDKELIYFRLNLGAMYAYCGEFDKAIKTYKKISDVELKSLPLSIRATYKNNIAIFRYKAHPSCIEASKQYHTLSNYLCKQYAEMATEEAKHLAINAAIFCILGDSDINTICENIKYANAICDDNYFKFYLQQVCYLYAVLYNTDFPSQVAADSVFFIDKKSFFEQKHLALLRAQKQRLIDIMQLNTFLSKELSEFNNDYDYFKNADMFSLIERWYE